MVRVDISQPVIPLFHADGHIGFLRLIAWVGASVGVILVCQAGEGVSEFVDGRLICKWVPCRVNGPTRSCAAVACIVHECDPQIDIVPNLARQRLHDG
jgi:hypothetical protein